MERWLQARLEKSDRIADRIIGGQAVVVVVDARKLYVLNEVGTFLWQRCDGNTVRRLVDEVVEHYDVSRERAARDIVRFVERLAGLGALRVVS